MKTTTNFKWRLLLTFTLLTIGFNGQKVIAQSGGPMWTLQSTYNIGASVTAVEFIQSTTNPWLAIGTQSESSGSLQIKDILTGRVVKSINPNGAVFALSSSAVIPYIAVGTIYGAYVYGLQNNKKITLQNIDRGRITDILWLDGFGNNSLQIVVGDQDGNISFFKLDTNSTYLNAYKTIPYKVNPAQPRSSSSVNSFCYWNNKFTAGFTGQIASWDTTGWVQRFRINEPKGPNGNARGMVVEDVASQNASFLLTADRDSIQAYNYDGSQRYRVPFYSGDSPVDMAFGANTFPFVAIGTSYDRCLLYKIEGNTATFLGNFSNHTFTVSSVDIRSYAIGNYYMATGSGDQTVEIWRYNPNFRP